MSPPTPLRRPLLALAFAMSATLAGGLAQAGDKRIHGSGWVGCRTQAYFLKLMDHAREDGDAYRRAMGAALVNGECVSLKAGESVTVIGSSAPLIRLRRDAGDELWTNRDAVK